MTGTSITIHSDALEYPLLSDDELESMAQSIAANGQRDPITLDQHGRIVDGRNRLEACRRAEVEPLFETIDFEDEDAICDFILDRNVEKRSLSNGQKAMFRAENLVRQRGNRVGGRWKRGTLDNTQLCDNSRGWLELMKKAGVVLDVAGRAVPLGDDYVTFQILPKQVKRGEVTLDAAYRIAQDFEAKAAMAEMAAWLPFTQASSHLEQLSIEAENADPLPVMDGPLTKAHRTQLEETAKRFTATATVIRTYLKENQ